MRFVLWLFLTLGLVPSQAHAATALFSLAIGYNGLPSGRAPSGVTVLSFADDDALAVHDLARAVARQSVVLAIPDRATVARHPSGREARPPTLGELRRALAELGVAIQRATLAGDETVVWLFYSGHGWLDDEGRANLTLADGVLSQDVLYDEVLPALPGRSIHLMIDACHAEALIRSRDLVAETVEISAAEVASASLRSRLAQLPNVGAIMASASNTQAHEWDDYQTGVFTHELLSGLRGGADVNSDGRVEYSEIAAFLAAANREVTDPRARLTTVVAAPRLYPRVAIVETRSARTLSHLQGRAHHLGRFQVDDRRGNRLIDLRAESGFLVDIAVPAGERIVLSNDRGEAALVAGADSPINLEDLTLNEKAVRPRGVVADSMRRGLFAAEFGPSYYGGFVDNADSHVVPVDLTPLATRVGAARPSRPANRRAAWSAFAVAGTSVVAASVFGVLAGRAYADFHDTNLERTSIAASDRYQRYGLLAVTSAVTGVLCGALGYWLWKPDRSVSASQN